MLFGINPWALSTFSRTGRVPKCREIAISAFWRCSGVSVLACSSWPRICCNRVPRRQA
eukprot:IDg4629t1